jgi:hypothetical protein
MGNIYKIITQAIGYMLAGLFLMKTSSTIEVNASLIVGFGWLFMGIGFVLVAVASFSKARKWVEKNIERQIYLTFFIVSLASMIIEFLNSSREVYIWVLLAFVLLVALVVIIDGVREGFHVTKNFGWKRLLVLLSVVASLFALGQLITQHEIFGGKILWLTVAILLLGMSQLVMQNKTKEIDTNKQ